MILNGLKIIKARCSGECSVDSAVGQSGLVIYTYVQRHAKVQLRAFYGLGHVWAKDFICALGRANDYDDVGVHNNADVVLEASGL